MDKQTKIYFFFFTIALLISTQSTIQSNTSTNQENKQVSINKWKLLSWNEVNATFWWSKGVYIQAEKGSTVTYNITSSEDNSTFPNSGALSIGNVTDIQTDNNDIASNLGLSIWPWMAGLVMNPNDWTYQKDEAKSASGSEFLQGTLEINEGLNYSILDFSRKAVEFTYLQNLTLGNQNTTLIFDLDSGVLLYGKSEFLGDVLYIIELELTSSTLIVSSNYNASGFTILFPITILVIIYSIRNRRFK
jgi:hypothetical protein